MNKNEESRTSWEGECGSVWRTYIVSCQSPVPITATALSTADKINDMTSRPDHIYIHRYRKIVNEESYSPRKAKWQFLSFKVHLRDSCVIAKYEEIVDTQHQLYPITPSIDPNYSTKPQPLPAFNDSLRLIVTCCIALSKICPMSPTRPSAPNRQPLVKKIDASEKASSLLHIRLQEEFFTKQDTSKLRMKTELGTDQ